MIYPFVHEVTDFIIITLLVVILVATCYSGYVILSFIAHVYKLRHEIAERFRNWIGPTMTSKYIAFWSSACSQNYRQLFKDHNVENAVSHASMRNHSHAEAARMRCYANTAMSNFITMLGYKEYSVSRSSSEEQAGVEGTRLYYHAKDLQLNVCTDTLTTDHIIKMTDVDYYVNMPDYLNGNHLIIYTFTPRRVAGATTDGTYRITEDNRVDTHVSGGGHYSHHIWDYETDHLMVDHWWGSSFYLVETKSLSDDRKIIFFNHIKNIYTPLAWFIPGFRLRHRQMVFDNVAYIKFMDYVDKIPTVLHSFASIRDNTCATVLDKQLVAIRTRLSHTKTPTMSDVERIIRMDVQEDAHIIAGILFEVLVNPKLGHLIFSNPHHPLTKVEAGDNQYMPLGPLVTEDGKPALRQITKPYMLDAAHPVRSYNSDKSCIQGRITDVKNPVKTVPPFYHQCLNEFARLIVPDHIANTLVPENYEFMVNAWTRPTQRSLLDRVKHVLYYEKPWAVKSFQKAESYAKVTHPRNISTLPTGFNARLGQYFYAFSTYVMKPCHWYAFGKAPADIGRTLSDKAKSANYAVVDDTTRLDGSSGFFQTEIIKTCALRAFAPPYKAELSRALDREAHATGFTSFGVMYKAEFNTLSGSSDTSAKNSLTTAFTHYVERRQAGLKPTDAYAALGMYGGDDGVTFDCDQDVLKRVFAKTGLLVKTDRIEMGRPVPFLGRYFIDPWTCPHSIADVPRQLRKLHLTATPSTVPRDMILLRKAEAILVTDSETPVLSEWAKAVIRHTNYLDRRAVSRMEHLIARDLSYWSKYEDPFPPSDNIELVRSVVADQLGDSLKIIMLENKFINSRNIDDMCLLVDDTPAKVDVNAVVQGVVVTTKPGLSHQQKLRTNARITPITSRASRIPVPIKQLVKTAAPMPTNGKAKPSNIKAKQVRFNKPAATNIASTRQSGTGTKPRGQCRYTAKGQPCKRTGCPFQHGAVNNNNKI